MKQIAFLLVLLVQIQVLAKQSPHEFFVPALIKLDAAITDWIQVSPQAELKSRLTVFKSREIKKGVQANLTLDKDQLREKESLKGYVENWIKRFPRFGYDVISKNKYTLRKVKGIVIDFVSNISPMQFRQVIFKRGKTVLIFTCSDLKESFRVSLRSCNAIIRSATWPN